MAKSTHHTHSIFEKRFFFESLPLYFLVIVKLKIRGPEGLFKPVNVNFFAQAEYNFEWKLKMATCGGLLLDAGFFL